MNKFFLISILYILPCKLIRAQSVDSIVNSYLSKVKTIKTVSYDIVRIDTFTTGEVWNHSGMCILKRDPNDKLFGYHFLGSRSDIDKASLYDGKTHFLLKNKNKKFFAEISPSKGILGSPGGQMVVDEFFNFSNEYEQINYTKNENSYIVRIDYKDDPNSNLKNHYKLLYLDVNSFLPQKVEVRLTALGNRQSSVQIVKNLKVNVATPFIDSMKFLDEYTQELPADQGDLEQLIGKKAFSFEAETFKKEVINLSQYKGKVVLLDFWDVWCAPCVKSMPQVEKIYQKYKNDGLVVLGVLTNGKNVDAAQKLLNKMNISYTNVKGNEVTIEKFKVRAIPQYVLIDETGVIMYTTAGYSEKMESVLSEKFDY